MTAPPGVARTTSSTRRSHPADIEDLKVAASAVLWNCGIDYGPSKIHRLCCQFVNRVQHNGFSFFDFIANKVELTAEQQRSALSDPDVARAIAYADPTGEAAVNNVMRGRHAH